MTCFGAIFTVVCQSVPVCLPDFPCRFYVLHLLSMVPPSTLLALRPPGPLCPGMAPLISDNSPSSPQLWERRCLKGDVCCQRWSSLSPVIPLKKMLSDMRKFLFSFMVPLLSFHLPSSPLLQSSLHPPLILPPFFWWWWWRC